MESAKMQELWAPRTGPVLSKLGGSGKAGLWSKAFIKLFRQ